jgi:CRISPR/Cas system CSM-associated protein Csm4 (group 5 of RAMP superfamily)
MLFQKLVTRCTHHEGDMYLIKNKTIKNIVLLINNNTIYLYPKGAKNDNIKVNELNAQLKNLKKMRFIQITKIG